MSNTRDSKYTAVVNAIRRIIKHWVTSQTYLIADANAGDTVLSVNVSRRFRVNDQILISNNKEDMENDHFIVGVPDQNTIVLASPLKWGWPMVNGANVIKTMNNQFVKAVYLGEPNVMPELPAITVNIKSASSEFLTLRGTKERYELEIGIYVSGTTLEEGDKFLWHLVDTVQYGLKRNFIPLLNDYATSTLLQDVTGGDIYISVADSSIFVVGQPMLIEDQYKMDMLGISAICDSTTVQVAVPVVYDFLQANTIITRPYRLPYNSWPKSVDFGLINKGTLLKAAALSYFLEEYEFQVDGDISDTQLT